MHSRTMWLLGAGLLAGAVFAARTQGLADPNPVGVNPNPVRLMRPAVAQPHRPRAAGPRVGGRTGRIGICLGPGASAAYLVM